MSRVIDTANQSVVNYSIDRHANGDSAASVDPIATQRNHWRRRPPILMRGESSMNRPINSSHVRALYGHESQFTNQVANIRICWIAAWHKASH